MTAGLQLVFKDMDRTAPVAAYVHDRFARLRRLLPDIIRCRVALSQPHRSRRTGNDFRAVVTLNIPGSALVAQSCEDPDLYTAIAKVFQGLDRQIRTGASKRSAHWQEQNSSCLRRGGWRTILPETQVNWFT